VEPLHAGDPRDGAALGALGDDQLARRLQEAVLVDRVGRRVLGGRALRAVEDPIGRDDDDPRAGGVGRVDELLGGSGRVELAAEG
jgi:hypothetical protein